jgi:hypothetical protein
MTFTATVALNDAMLSGGIDGALDDHPTNHAYAVLYAAGAAALVTMQFAKPAAVLVNHELVFAQQEPTGDFIYVEGNAVAFDLFSGSGVLLGSGDVSGMAGSGALKVSGTTGSMLFAGARAILGQLKFV